MLHIIVIKTLTYSFYFITGRNKKPDDFIMASRFYGLSEPAICTIEAPYAFEKCVSSFQYLTIKLISSLIIVHPFNYSIGFYLFFQ